MSEAKTIEIQVGNKSRKVQAPASWNDLDQRTLHLFYQTLFTAPGDEFTATAFTAVKLISMTRALLGMDDAMMAQWEHDCLRQDPENGQTVFFAELKSLITAVLSGLFSIEETEEGNTVYACRLNLTRNPYPKLSHTTRNKKGEKKKTTWLYCAEDGLANITIYELASTFTIFEQYLAMDNEALANQLIGTLYRPGKPQSRLNLESEYQGDRRQPLRKYEKKVAERAALAATLPPLVKRLILFWFASCRQQIVERYGKVFKPSSGDSKPGYGWGGVLLAIAGGPTGLESIADQHYSNALTWLAMKEDERADMEEQMRLARKK